MLSRWPDDGTKWWSWCNLTSIHCCWNLHSFSLCSVLSARTLSKLTTFVTVPVDEHSSSKSDESREQWRASSWSLSTGSRGSASSHIFFITSSSPWWFVPISKPTNGITQQQQHHESHRLWSQWRLWQGDCQVSGRKFTVLASLVLSLTAWIMLGFFSSSTSKGCQFCHKLKFVHLYLLYVI